MQDFSVEGGPQNVLGGPIFRGWNEFLLLGKALHILGNFSKISIKINNKLEKYWENSRKNADFSENFF